MPEVLEAEVELPTGFSSWTEVFNTFSSKDKAEFIESLDNHQSVTLSATLRKEEVTKARINLDAWGRMIAPNEPPAKHHRLINNRLEAIENGDIDRLMIFAPPGSAKTTYTSRRFPAWVIGRNPTHNYIFGTHTLPFAESISFDVQRIVQSEDFFDTFGFGMSKTVTAKAEWMNEMGGKYYATGVDVGVAGKRADGFIGDDFIRNRKEAMSSATRRNQFEWYRTDIRPRLKPTAWRIITVTRWHESDIPGSILGTNYDGGSGTYKSADDTEEWHVLSLPATETRLDNPLFRKIGDPLWAEWFLQKDPEFFSKEKIVQGSYNWAALFQQMPILEGGITLQRDWFRIEQKIPDTFDKIVRFWDMAGTEQSVKNTDPDWTVGSLVGVSKGQYWILDIERFRGSPKTVEDRVKATADKDGATIPIWIEQEPGSAGKAIIDQYQRKVLFGWPCRGERSTGSKISRADILAAPAEAGNVILQRADWNETFLQEAEVFPVGGHDDQIDSASGACKVMSDKIKKSGTWGR